MLELQNNIQLLQNRVKELESELESQKVSGGVKIPIVFRSIEKKTSPKNIIFSPKPSMILSDILSENSENSERSENVSISAPVLPKVESKEVKPEEIKLTPPKSPKKGKKTQKKSKSVSPPKSPKKTMEIELNNSELNHVELNHAELNHNDIDLDNISGVSNIEKELEISTPPKTTTPPNSVLGNEVEQENDDKVDTKKKKKPSMPDAKNYQNGEKITFNDEEYICVVGKRGGHSWKKI